MGGRTVPTERPATWVGAPRATSSSSVIADRTMFLFFEPAQWAEDTNRSVA
jgi:hypothetical protein